MRRFLQKEILYSAKRQNVRKDSNHLLWERSVKQHYIRKDCIKLRQQGVLRFLFEGRLTVFERVTFKTPFS